MAPQRQKCEDLLGQMREERESWRSQWVDLSTFIEPTRSRLWITDSNRGDRRNYRIIDPTATLAARTLVSGMMSGMTNPARPWFRITVPDADMAELQTIKDWTYEVTARLHTILARSNFYDAVQVAYNDLGVFGTSATLMEEDEDDVVRYQTIPVGSFYVADDKYRRVRYFAREYEVSVSQAIEMFGEDNPAFTPSTLASFKNGELRARVQLAQMVMPNPESDGQSDNPRYAPFVSYHWESGGSVNQTAKREDERGFLRVSGYREFPVLCGRWAVTGDDSYATNCPGMTAIGDVRQLQVMEKRKLQALDKIVSPPMIAPTGLRNQQMSFAAGGVTFNPMPNVPIAPAQVPTFDAQVWNLEQATVRQRVQRAFYEDLFLMLAANPGLDAAGRTAREIEERHEEKLLAIGPVLQRLEKDILSPMVDRLFAIAARIGLMPPIPPELEGMELKIEYVSIIAQAQKLTGVGGYERWVNQVVALAANAGDPSILDVANFEEGLSEYADNLGVAPLAVRSLEDIAAIRDARAQQQAQMQQAEQAKMEADALAKLSQAKIGSGDPSVLSQVLSQGQGVPSEGALPIEVM